MQPPFKFIKEEKRFYYPSRLKLEKKPLPAPPPPPPPEPPKEENPVEGLVNKIRKQL